MFGVSVYLSARLFEETWLIPDPKYSVRFEN